MLLKAAEKYNIDLAESWMVEDQPQDVEAGTATGCRTVQPYEQTNLLDAVRYIKL